MCIDISPKMDYSTDRHELVYRQVGHTSVMELTRGVFILLYFIIVIIFALFMAVHLFWFVIVIVFLSNLLSLTKSFINSV